MEEEKFDWIEMMEKMQEIRLFASLNTRGRREGAVSPQETDILSRIIMSDTPLTPLDMAAITGLSKPAVSRLAESLEKKGFLLKQYSKKDKRSYTLHITEKGNNEIEQVYHHYLEPVYRLRRTIGEERFKSLMAQIKEANYILKNKGGRKMTFYQELQLDQAGSKAYIASFKNPKDKIKHTGVYLFKILLNIAFCTAFIAVFSMLSGKENSIAGLAVLLSIMVFRYADLGICTSHGVCSILVVFGILAAGPKLSNMLPPGWAFLANVVFIMFLMLLGCHNVVMYNHSTLVLAYLLLQGYDVSGSMYGKRIAGLFAGAVITAAVYYHNHRKKNYKRTFKSIFQEFDLSSSRTKWQLRLTLVISSVMFIASVLDAPKAMWIGIAAMSVCVPFRSDMDCRVKYRAPGNILGSFIFLAVYLLLPEGSVAYMGILGGIGTGLSASYGWQAVFNAFSSLATAVPVFGLPYAIMLRVFYNISGTLYTWLFDQIFEPAISALAGITNFVRSKFQNNINVME